MAALIYKIKNNEEKINSILKYWNPTGDALAAEYWENDIKHGFTPVCTNKKNRSIGCQLFLKDRACKYCNTKSYSCLTDILVEKHLEGQKRLGIYPIINSDQTSWVAADLDNHNGTTDPAQDAKTIINVAEAIGIPISIFTSNSNEGLHVYTFFDAPVPAYKARSLIFGLLERSGIDITHRRDKQGSFDCIFPKQDSLSGIDIGNLIAMPWSGDAIRNRNSTLYLDSSTLTIARNIDENIQAFIDDVQPIPEIELDAILRAMDINPGIGPARHGNLNIDLSNLQNQCLNKLVDSCSFLSHCKDNAASLPEPQWYDMIGVLAREYQSAQLIHALSRPYPKYSQQETTEKILHAINDQPGPITCAKIKTNFDCGKDCGVTCPIHLTTNQPKPISVTQISPAEPRNLVTPIPNILLNPGGILQETLDYLDSMCPVSIPEFNLACAMALIGTVGGHKICGPTGIRTNLYCLILGNSGSGKDGGPALIKEILSDTVELNHLIGGSKFTGGAAIYSAISSVPGKYSKLFFLDEFAKILKRERSKNNSAETIGSAFLELYSGTSGQKSFADTAKNQQYPWQHVSLIGSATPDDLWAQITPTDLQDGFIARLQIFESNHKPQTAEYEMQLYHENKPKKLIKHLIEIDKIKLNLDNDCIGNIETTAATMQKEVPFKLPRTKEALDFLKSWDAVTNEKQCAFVGKWQGYIYNRARETGEKYCHIHHMSKYGHNCISHPLGIESYQYGLALVDHLNKHMINMATNYVSENDWHAMEQKVLRAIQSKSTTDKPGVSQAVLFGRLVKIPERDRRPLISGLISTGELMVQKYKGKTGPETDILCLSKINEEP